MKSIFLYNGLIYALVTMASRGAFCRSNWVFYFSILAKPDIGCIIHSLQNHYPVILLLSVDPVVIRWEIEFIRFRSRFRENLLDIS